MVNCGLIGFCILLYLSSVKALITPCEATEYVCSASSYGSKSYCQQWASDTVCYYGKCYTPSDCQYSITPTLSPTFEGRSIGTGVNEEFDPNPTDGEKMWAGIITGVGVFLMCCVVGLMVASQQEAVALMIPCILYLMIMSYVCVFSANHF